MYDKFDDDVEKSGLRFDGNRPTFDRRRIRKIVTRSAWIIFAFIFVLVFYMRQSYNLNERYINDINVSALFAAGLYELGTDDEPFFYRGSHVVSYRTQDVYSGRIIISDIHYIDGGRGGAQIRFRLFIPNPFFRGDIENLSVDARLNGNRVPAPYTLVDSFWFCQTKDVTFTFTERTVPPRSGDTMTITISGEGISATVSFVMP